MDTSIANLSGYQAPTVRVQQLHMENAICDSPVPGGNEDIGYEEWS